MDEESVPAARVATTRKSSGDGVIVVVDDVVQSVGAAASDRLEELGNH